MNSPIVPNLTNPKVTNFKSTDRSERVELAQQLINFDRKFSELFGGKSAIAEQAGISVEEFRNLWLKSGKWTSGTAVQYPPSLLVAASSAEKELLAANIHIGSVSFQASDDREGKLTVSRCSTLNRRL